MTFKTRMIRAEDNLLLTKPAWRAKISPVSKKETFRLVGYSNFSVFALRR